MISPLQEQDLKTPGNNSSSVTLMCYGDNDAGPGCANPPFYPVNVPGSLLDNLWTLDNYHYYFFCLYLISF